MLFHWFYVVIGVLFYIFSTERWKMEDDRLRQKDQSSNERFRPATVFAICMRSHGTLSMIGKNRSRPVDTVRLWD